MIHNKDDSPLYIFDSGFGDVSIKSCADFSFFLFSVASCSVIKRRNFFMISTFLISSPTTCSATRTTKRGHLTGAFLSAELGFLSSDYGIEVKIYRKIWNWLVDIVRRFRKVILTTKPSIVWLRRKCRLSQEITAVNLNADSFSFLGLIAHAVNYYILVLSVTPS